jgi:hypothetical protein
MLERYDSIEEISGRFERLFQHWGLPAIAAGAAGLFFDLGVRDVGVLLGAASVFFFVVFAWKRKRGPVPLPPRADFIVDRDQRLAEALATMEANNGFLLLSGESGVGKSVLTRSIVKALDTRDTVAVIQRHNYGEFQADTLRRALREIAPTHRTLFVLDQMEKVFQLDPASADKELDLVGRLISDCAQNEAWSCILVVRREWFLHLAIFPELRPMLGRVQLVGGFEPGAEEEAYASFRLHLIDLLTGNANLVDAVLAETKQLERPVLTAGRTPQVVPVRALAAVDALRYLREQKGVEHTSASYHQAGGFRGIMHVYFASFFAASGRSDDAARVLAALSVNPRAGRMLTDRQIAGTTCVPLHTTKELLDFFTKAKLLQLVERRYDWIHDFFAESFNDLSGSFLTPADRDNISHSRERVDEVDEESSPRRDEDTRGARLSLWLFAISALLLWSRTLMLPWIKELAATPWSAPMYHPVDLLAVTWVDASFVPVALALTAWAWYTTALLRRVLCRLGEPAWARRFSYFVAAASTLLVCLSVAFPRWWVVFTGIGGLLVGIKYLQVGSRMGTGWLRTELFFGHAGWSTCLNCFFTSALGVAFALFLAGRLWPVDSERAAAVSLGITAGMLCFAFVASALHIRKKRVPSLVGMYRRYSAG